MSRGARAALVLAAGLALAGTARADRITFRVSVPATTPAGDTLWISGDVPELGGWNGAGVPFVRADEHWHDATVTLARGTVIEFKVTRGSWGTVEKGIDGRELSNRRYQVAGDDTLLMAVGAWRDQVETVPRTPTWTGDIRRHPKFGSRHVGPRDVLVYLPPGYEAQPERRYPVLYFQDGQNVFDATTSTIGVEWGVDEAAEKFIRSGFLPPFIVVAIASTGERVAEYTPAADGRYGGGRADDYARFLIGELMPFVDATYRTRTGAAHTGVAGSSLGGILSLYLGLEHPDVFGAVACVSPSVWFADGDIVERVKASAGPGPRVWLDMGTHEGRTPKDWKPSIRGARRLRDALRKRGWREGTTLHYQEFEGAEHSERAWSARIEPILRFLMGEAPAGR